jgi:hypothetical protein
MIRRLACTGLTVAVSLVALCARAEDYPTDAEVAGAQGGEVFLGLRSGYALPFGAIEKGGALNDVFNGHVPLWLDVGYKLTPNLLVGLYGQYGFGLIKSADSGDPDGCPSGVDCSGHVIRFGAQVHYQFGPGGTMNPWVGYGFGYEFMSLSMGDGISFGASGFEFALFQLGIDSWVAKGVGIGPFVALSLGQYSDCSAEINGVTGCSLGPQRFHEWLTLGLRGAFEL